MTKIIWLIGQAGHGKTVLAKLFEDYIDRVGVNDVLHIDGDDLRNLTINKDYSRFGREQNIRNAQVIAKYLQNKGFHVVVSLMTPYRDLREEFKENTENVYEIYVHTTDIRGREQFHVEDFQKPVFNYLDMDTTNITPEESLKEIIDYVGLV
jgi:adenylylsulfate kinase-like enzyme